LQADQAIDKKGSRSGMSLLKARSVWRLATQRKFPPVRQHGQRPPAPSRRRRASGTTRTIRTHHGRSLPVLSEGSNRKGNQATVQAESGPHPRSRGPAQYELADRPALT
jgi:hypothetical protein